MGKKVRCRTKKTSKGERKSISNSTVRLVREGRSEIDKYYNKLEAWKKGKKGFVTIANPNSHETDKPFIKVSFDRYFGGVYKNMKYRMRPSDDNDRIEI